MRPAVYLEWVDACQPDHGNSWVEIPEAEPDPTPDCLCWTVGWITREDDGYLWIAHSFTGDDASPRIIIPKQMIKRRVPITIPLGGHE